MRQIPKRASIKRGLSRRTSFPGFGVETLEGRQLFSVTGFSLLNQASFPGLGATVTSQPTIFQSGIQQSWQSLANGQLKIQGQTLQQEVASAIQQAAKQGQGLSAYNISSSFNTNGTYNGFLKSTAPSGSVLELDYDATGNHTTFTTTTNSIFGSYADPTFHVTYDLKLTIDLSLPSNLASGKISATANAAVSNVTVSSNSILVGVLNLFGTNVTQKIANGINGSQTDLSSIVPTGLLSSALQFEATQGYTHLHTGLDNGGNLQLIAQKPALTVNGVASDHITISAGAGGSVVVTEAGKTQTFDAGFLNSITVKI